MKPCGAFAPAIPKEEKKESIDGDGRPIPPLSNWIIREDQGLNMEQPCYRAEWGAWAFSDGDWSTVSTRSELKWEAPGLTYGHQAFSHTPFLAVMAACGACKARAAYSTDVNEFSGQLVWESQFRTRFWENSIREDPQKIPDHVKQNLSFRCEPQAGYGGTEYTNTTPRALRINALAVQVEIDKQRCEKQKLPNEPNDRLALEFGPYLPWPELQAAFFKRLPETSESRHPDDQAYLSALEECRKEYGAFLISVDPGF